MKLLLYAAILCSFVSYSRADEKSASINDFMGKIRANIPTGWSVSYEKQNDWLEVSRDESVLCTSASPNSNPTEENRLQQFSFAFRISPKMPLTEYRKLSKQNLVIQGEMKMIYDELVKRHVPRKFDSFLAQTDGDKTLAFRYDSLKNSTRDLPDFYFQDISMTWALNSPANPTISVIDPKIHKECNSVRTEVGNLAFHYK